MRKIICNVYGGLGNQLFQICFLLTIAEENFIDNLHIDISSIDSFRVKRNFSVNKLFKLPIPIRKHIITRLRVPRLTTLNTSLISLINDKNYQDIKPYKGRLILMDGYFQRLSKRNENAINKIKNAYEYYSTIPKLDAVIHIRGGDFLTDQHREFNDHLYYQSAIKMLLNYYQRGRDLIVITDDTVYAKDLLSQVKASAYYNLVYTESNFLDDFNLLTNSKIKIISTSTFSFWAALIGEDNSKTIIAPDVWYNGTLRYFKLKNEVNVFE